jgi:hypothetical protein
VFSVPKPDPHVPPLSLASDESSPPRPIGPERLRALREAILNGTYPLDAAVLSGLTALFRSDGATAAASAPPHPGVSH